MKEERKQNLIKALETERELFESRGMDTEEHDITIQFLRLGRTLNNPNCWGLLDAAMNDFDTLCYDYGC
jgi:hypothetical protein